jgi:two-component system cell cycle sensor histidine kinase/response regulator CckA
MDRARGRHTGREELNASAQAVQELLTAVSTAYPGLHVCLDTSGVVLSGEMHAGCVMCESGILTGVELFGQLSPDIRQKTRDSFQRALQTGAMQSFESDLGNEQETHACAICVVPVAQTRVYVFGRDISDVRLREKEDSAVEEQLRQVHKMEALGQLAGGVAHDFNNLLTVISGHAEIIRGTLPSDSPGLSSLDKINEASQGAASLTRRLLDFNRTHVLHPETIDLNRMIGDLQRFLGRLLRDDVTLELGLCEDLQLIRADTASIEQLLVSLADNAADAMAAGGVFRITTENVSLTEEDLKGFENRFPGEYVDLRVSDTGSGMSEETRRRAFEPLFTTKSEARGTGLGLASVYRIVQRADALIELTSEEDQGATFRILFPIAVQPLVGEYLEGELMPQNRVLRGRETLLVCEDDEGVRGVIVTTLLGAGYMVLVASSPEEALRLEDAHDDVLQLLVTDAVMSQKTGAQLAMELRQSRPGLRVLYVSGYSAEVLSNHVDLDHEDALLPKPFTPRDLLMQVRELLDRDEFTGAEMSDMSGTALLGKDAEY